MQRPGPWRRAAYRTLEAALGLVFLGVVAHHVARLEFKPLAALCVPILLVYFAFASLLYARARSVERPSEQKRSLSAAETTVQAAVWQLFGIVLGVGLYGAIRHFGLSVDPADPWPQALWLFAFLVPYGFMQLGLLGFLRAVWQVAPPRLTFPRW